MSEAQGAWIHHLSTRIRNAVRRLIPVYWRKGLRDTTPRLGLGYRVFNESIRHTAARPAVIVFCAEEDRTAGARFLDAFREDGWQVLHLDANRNDLRSVEALINERAIDEALCVVQHPAWEPTVAMLRERYGWKILVDGIALNQVECNTKTMLEAKQRLLAESGLLPANEPGSDHLSRLALGNTINQLYGKVSLIVVSFNGLDLIRPCVASILERTIYPNFDIIIVDNDSDAAVKAYLRELEHNEYRVRVLFNDTNRGFAAANNIGLNHARDSEFVVLLNNDTAVPRGWLCRLLRHARQPDVGLVGPVTNWTGNEAKINVSYHDLGEMEVFARDYVRAHEGSVFDIRSLAMYCVAMRRGMVDQIGLLDERYGIGMFEDEDYARRVRQAGYRVICAEDAFVHHHGMASFGKLPDSEYRAIFEQNKRLYEDKWGEPWVPYRARSN